MAKTYIAFLIALTVFSGCASMGPVKTLDGYWIVAEAIDGMAGCPLNLAKNSNDELPPGMCPDKKEVQNATSK